MQTSLSLLRAYEPIDAAIWGPPFWFFLHTLAYHYPEQPNNVHIKKYTDLLYNLPVFLPDADMATDLANLMITYPPTPYLSSRYHFLHWVNFLHNYYNERLGKPIPPMTVEESIKHYEKGRFCSFGQKAALAEAQQTLYRRLLFAGMCMFVIAAASSSFYAA